MNKSTWQLIKPHAIAIGIFLVVSCIYCLPVLKGMELNQSDTSNWKEISQQSFEFKEKHGHLPLWTNAIFSGMPAYQVAMESKYNITLAHLHHVFTLFMPQPLGLFFLACVGFYILCITFRLRTWVSILAAIGYAYASYSAAAISAGHVTKFASMGYAPALLAGLVLLTQRKYVIGFLTTLLFATLLMYQNHVQIFYYTALIAACIGIAFAVTSIRQKDIKHLLVTGALTIVAVGMGIASYAIVLLPTNEFAKESMRGGRSELKTYGKAENRTAGGLDKDYAFLWSYGMKETFTFIVPRIYGGASPSPYNNEWGESSKAAEVFAARTGYPEDEANQFVRQNSAYWGTQPSTSGPVYFGAVICFLFIVGLVYYREWHLGWIVAATIIGIVLSWGKNWESLNYFLFDNLPFYKKFRAPSMALVIPQVTFPLLAALGLNKFISTIEEGTYSWKKFKPALYATLGLFIVLAGLYFTFDYTSPNDASVRENLSTGMAQQMARGQQPSPEMQQQANDFGRSFVSALKDDRRRLFGNDLLRSFFLVAISAGLLLAYARKKLALNFLLIALTGLTLFDMIGVDLRYLSHNNYSEKEEVEFVPNRADLQVMQDTSYYRVLDQVGGNPFYNSRASYFHNSVGGHTPARLALYDDLIQYQLLKGNMQVFNMLNTKYIIAANPADQQAIAQQNPDALGAAWLVKSLKYVDNADEEMRALDAFDPRDTAIVDKREQPKISFTPQFDSAAYITLNQNINDYISYDFNASTNQFVVFSEIYYSEGWKAFIDGKQTPIVRVNYALRGLPVPAGKHTIEFRFEPKSYILGDRISLIAGIISILALIGGLWYAWRNYRKKVAVS